MMKSAFDTKRMRARWMAVLLFSLPLPVVALDLDQRIDEIEQVHFSQPWPKSQQMIDALRPALEGAGVDQRAHVDLFEARNLMLSGQIDQGSDLLQQTLSAPISLSLRLRALELLIAGHSLRDDHERAFFYLGQAVELLESSDAPVVHASLFEIAARLHADIGEYPLALEYAAESLAVARRADDERAMCIGQVGLALVQRKAGLLNHALRDTDFLWQQCQQSGDPILIASSLLVIGWLANAAGNYREAIGWLRRAMDRYGSASDNTTGFNDARLELGRALLGAGEIEAALEHLQEGLKQIEISWLWSKRELHLLIAEAHARLQSYSEALESLDRARDAMLHEVDEDRLRRLAYLQVDFDQQRRKLELDLAREQNRLLEAREESERVQHRTRLLGMAMIGLVLVLMIWLLLRFRRDRRRFARMSRIDGLTGLLNHKHFHQLASETLARSRQSSRPCALIAADLDLFKQVNDRFGHRAGDAVLEYLGRHFREQFPSPAIVGRIGGEEFAFFLPGRNRLQARQRVEQLRHSLQPVEFNGNPIPFTMSFGIAESRGRTGMEQLRSSADAALYRAKRSGRDEVVDAADAPNGGASAG